MKPKVTKEQHARWVRACEDHAFAFGEASLKDKVYGLARRVDIISFALTGDEMCRPGNVEIIEDNKD